MPSGKVLSVLSMALVCSAVQITCSPVNKSDANTESNDESVGTQAELPDDVTDNLVRLGLDGDKAEDIKSGIDGVGDEQVRERLVGGLTVISESSSDFISACMSQDPLGVATSSLTIIGGLLSLSENLAPGLIGVGIEIVSNLLSAILGETTEETPSMESVVRTVIKEEINNLVIRLIEVDQQVSHERLGLALHSVTMLSSIEEPNDIDFNRLLIVWGDVFTKYSQYQHAMKNFLLAPTVQLTMSEGSQYLEMFELYAMDFSTFTNVAQIIKIMLTGKTICQNPSESAHVCQELLATIDIALSTKRLTVKRVLESLHFPPKFFAPIAALYYSKENNDKFINMEKMITQLGGKQKNVNCFYDPNFDFSTHHGVYLKSGTDFRKLLAAHYYKPTAQTNYFVKLERFDCNSPELTVVDIIPAGTDGYIHGQSGATNRNLPVTHTDPILKARYGTPNQAFIFSPRPSGKDRVDSYCSYFKTCVLGEPKHYWWSCDSECADNTGVYNLIQINSGSPSTSKTFIITEYSHSRHLIIANELFYQADIYDLKDLKPLMDFEFRLVNEYKTAPCNDQGSTCPVQ